jgi:hypothetical protein
MVNVKDDIQSAVDEACRRQPPPTEAEIKLVVDNET